MMSNATARAADALLIDTSVVTKILCGFIHDEVHKVGYSRVVVGLSGGVDSALVAAIAQRSLGANNVAPIFMPYRMSDPTSQKDAEAICAALGLQLHTVDISPQVDAYFAVTQDADQSRRGNKMARERMSVLYDMSIVLQALVLGTSNKSELLLGYGTLFGDMASALNPIGDLYKMQVYMLARSFGLPNAVLDKAPSADLWHGQTDEDELGMSYEVADAILYLLVDERRSPQDIVAMGFASDVVERVASRVRNSQYKRRLPIIAKLSTRTVDREFRYPRDWSH